MTISAAVGKISLPSTSSVVRSCFSSHVLSQSMTRQTILVKEDLFLPLGLVPLCYRLVWEPVQDLRLRPANDVGELLCLGSL